MKTNLQKLQNRAARIITGDTYDIRSKQILEKLDWKPLEERREDKLKKYMRKIVEGDCPEIISNLFKKCVPNRNAMKRSFSYKGAKVWNTHNKYAK